MECRAHVERVWKSLGIGLTWNDDDVEGECRCMEDRRKCVCS